MSATDVKPNKTSTEGRIRIGDDWNAIRIIALSQSNPLKAIAEFVENSIDAKARNITIIRGKEDNVPFLRIKDDGEGVRRNADGRPDFRYVATHVCDSIKRRMKQDGILGLQGEFGIGLLSFWTVGEELTLISAGADGKTWQMKMRKEEPGYEISPKRVMFPEGGVELLITRLLPGIRGLSGEKIQWYLASELRDRIRTTGVQIKVVDRTSRAEFKVVPRQFEGRLLHDLARGRVTDPDLYFEVYLNPHNPSNVVSLCRSGTRVVDSIASLPGFNQSPWTSGCLQGLVDASFLTLTPGTRTGVIQDEAFARLEAALAPVAEELERIIQEQQRAEEERASKDVLRSIQSALREALLALPAEEYDWFQIRSQEERAAKRAGESSGASPGPGPAPTEPFATPGEEGAAMVMQDAMEPPQKQFWESSGPLFSVKISPASSVVPVNQQKNLRAIARDQSRRIVEDNVTFTWQITEGAGTLENSNGEIVTFVAPSEPGLTRLKVHAVQNGSPCEAEALITITDSLLPPTRPSESTRQGLPDYTFQKAPGELWRSRYDNAHNVIIINNGHRDFVYASRTKVLKTRYVARLFAKELVLKNFAGTPPDALLERLIELGLYMEENLK